MQDSISYRCEEGMYFDDGNTTKQTPCTCDSIDEVLSWGTCAIPPPVTRKPGLFLCCFVFIFDCTVLHI